MIEKENKLVEFNRSKGIGKTTAFEAYPVNLNSKKPMKDEKGRIINAITLETLTKKLTNSLSSIRTT